MRRIYDAIMAEPCLTVPQYSKITGIPCPEINAYLNNDVDGRAFVYQNMVALSTKGRLPRWALDLDGNPRIDIPVVESVGKALVVMPDAFVTGEKKIDTRTNRCYQGIKELVVARSGERQDIVNRLGTEVNSMADALLASERYCEAWKLTSESLAATVRANEKLVEAKEEIIYLMKAAKG